MDIDLESELIFRFYFLPSCHNVTVCVCVCVFVCVWVIFQNLQVPYTCGVFCLFTVRVLMCDAGLEPDPRVWQVHYSSDN